MLFFSKWLFWAALLLNVYGCGSYDKKNVTAAAVSAEMEAQARKARHPGLHTVEILDMLFQPSALTVKKGDTVIWVNQDMLAHDVTGEGGRAWKSGPLQSGGTWQKVITESADYFCSLHAVMKGRIIVEGEKVAGR